jgi:hypothetical protein
VFVGKLDFVRRWGIFFFLVNVWGYVFHGKSSVPLYTSKLDLYLRKQLINYYNWSIAWYGAETWTLQKVDQKYWKVLKCGAGEDELD